MRKIIIVLMALLLVACSKQVSSVDEAVAIARENANLSVDNSELIQGNHEDDKYYVELADEANVYRYVIDEDGKVQSFVKEAKNNNETSAQPSKQDNNETTNNNSNTDVIDREKALSIALSNYYLTEDQVYEIEIDEDFLHSKRLTYNIDFKTEELEYEVVVDASGNIVRDNSDRNDDRVSNFVTSISRQEAIDMALEANGHNYNDVDELTIKQSTHFDNSYYEIDYEIGNRDYEMTVDANTLEIREDY